MNPPTSLPILNAQHTADLLPFALLCRQLASAAVEYQAGQISSPERQVLPLAGDGVMLSMPATAHDIGMHKLVNVCPANSTRQLPTINGIVSVYHAKSGLPLLVLDGPTVTARRTAAVSMLAMSLLQPAAPSHVSLIGSGKQAAAHLDALATLYPGIRVDVHSRNPDSAQTFCQQHASLKLQLQAASGGIAAESTVVIMLTTSKLPVYQQAARLDRLLIGVGAFKPDMAELGPLPIAGSQLFTDDPAGAHHEAGDLIQAGIDWNRVASLADAVEGRVDPTRPVIFKSVGSAAWDLAAARCALQCWHARHLATP